MDQIMTALQTALQNSNQAVGETQARQAGAQIEAIKQMAIMQLSNAMGDQIQIRNVRQMQDTADTLYHRSQGCGAE